MHCDLLYFKVLQICSNFGSHDALSEGRADILCKFCSDKRRNSSDNLWKNSTAVTSHVEAPLWFLWHVITQVLLCTIKIDSSVNNFVIFTLSKVVMCLLYHVISKEMDHWWVWYVLPHRTFITNISQGNFRAEMNCSGHVFKQDYFIW